MKEFYIILSLVLVVGISGCGLLLKSLHGSQGSEENQMLLEERVKKEVEVLHQIIDKLNPITPSFTVKATTQQEIVIQVYENDQVFSSIMDDLEMVVRTVLQPTEFEHFSIIVERAGFPDAKQIHKGQMMLNKKLLEGLQPYDVIGDINTGQNSITIHTSIKGMGKKAKHLSIEIEKTVRDLLSTISTSKTPSYEIHVLNQDGKRINNK
ncbi:hypothetical protein LCL95_10050 [Bacillus timonensis]|nr:hypothetical protein [Bacillus timonensis]